MKPQVPLTFTSKRLHGAIPTSSTPQEIFDFVCSNLIKQGCGAIGSGRACVYRTDDGKKCAAGWLIKDESYNPIIEGKNIAGIIQDGGITSDILPDIIMMNSGLVKQLQNAHDAAALDEVGRELSFLDEFKTNARKVASMFNLNTDVLND